MATTALKKTIALISGTSTILFGVVLLVLPGPGLLFIALGLAILATEFTWARSLLHGMKTRVQTGYQSIRNRMQARRGASSNIHS